MATFFLVSAILGGTVFVLQLGLVGPGAEALHLHLGADHGGSVGDAFDLLSIRALSAGIAFLGSGGRALPGDDGVFSLPLTLVNDGP